MATWYYKGKTPVTVDTVDRGSVVIVRRTKFEAHEHSVSHLVKVGLVVRVAGEESGEKDRSDTPATENVAVTGATPSLDVVQSEELQSEQSEQEVLTGETSISDTDPDVVGSAQEAEAEREVDGSTPEKKQNRLSKRGRH